MRIIVSGLIGQHQLAGVAWDFAQYLLGFEKLGHEVCYLEDTGAWPYHHEKQQPDEDASGCIQHIQNVLKAFRFQGEWIYRNGATGQFHGSIPPEQADLYLASGEVLANVAGSCWLRESTQKIPHKLFLDGDPMFNQVRFLQDPEGRHLHAVKTHNHHFSFGLNLGKPDCAVPLLGLEWKPTFQPVCLNLWTEEQREPHLCPAPWTTVMNWFSYDALEWKGHDYGQKDRSFLEFEQLPSLLPDEHFMIAMNAGIGLRRPTERLQKSGWQIQEPSETIADSEAYRRFILGSKGEWSIAKHGYVASKSGWFSCRTACYLAAGRPCVVQDTGWSEYLPTGAGLHRFTTLEEAARAIELVAIDYERQALEARNLAEEFFEAGKVCQKLLNDAGIG